MQEIPDGVKHIGSGFIVKLSEDCFGGMFIAYGKLFMITAESSDAVEAQALEKVKSLKE